MTRTYLDAGILIAAIRGLPDLAARILALLADPDREFVSGAFTRLELLPKAVYHRNLAEVAFYQAFFQRVTTWAEPLDRIVELAEQVASRQGLNALDALHVASAILLDADELVTTERSDEPIHRVTSVNVVGL